MVQVCPAHFVGLWTLRRAVSVCSSMSATVRPLRCGQMVFQNGDQPCVRISQPVNFGGSTARQAWQALLIGAAAAETQVSEQFVSHGRPLSFCQPARLPQGRATQRHQQMCRRGQQSQSGQPPKQATTQHAAVRSRRRLDSHIPAAHRTKGLCLCSTIRQPRRASCPMGCKNDASRAFSARSRWISHASCSACIRRSCTCARSRSISSAASLCSRRRLAQSQSSSYPYSTHE